MIIGLSRKLERERRKEKIKQAKKDGVVLPPNRKQLRKCTKEPVDINVVVDCSFESYMSELELRKLIKQIQHCYAINRRANTPFKVRVAKLYWN